MAEPTVPAAEPDTTHECPADGCHARVEQDKLMCRADWARVARPLQAAVYAAWRHGAGFGSPEHLIARQAAVDAANASRAASANNRYRRLG